MKNQSPLILLCVWVVGGSVSDSLLTQGPQGLTASEPSLLPHPHTLKHTHTHTQEHTSTYTHKHTKETHTNTQVCTHFC